MMKGFGFPKTTAFLAFLMLTLAPSSVWCGQEKKSTANPTNDPLAINGFINHKREAPLRIDVTQHQMHAVILALEYVYAGAPRSAQLRFSAATQSGS